MIGGGKGACMINANTETRRAKNEYTDINMGQQCVDSHKPPDLQCYLQHYSPTTAQIQSMLYPPHDLQTGIIITATYACLVTHKHKRRPSRAVPDLSPATTQPTPTLYAPLT